MTIRLNSTTQRLLAASLVVASLGLGGCATTITHGAYAYRPHGIWHDYDYYPAADVYVDIVSGHYWHRENDRWQRVRRPPPYLRPDAPDRVRLRLDSVRPYERHAEHRARYRGDPAEAPRSPGHRDANVAPRRGAAGSDGPRDARRYAQGSREARERRTGPGEAHAGHGGSGTRERIHADRAQARPLHRAEPDNAPRRTVRDGSPSRAAGATQPAPRADRAAPARTGNRVTLQADRGTRERRLPAAARARDADAKPTLGAGRAGGVRNANGRRSTVARDEDAPRTAADRVADTGVPR